MTIPPESRTPKLSQVHLWFYVEFPSSLKSMMNEHVAVPSMKLKSMIMGLCERE